MPRERSRGSEPIYKVKVQKDVVAAMRDRTKLYSDVYLPDGEGPFPVLIERTPYNKEECGEVSIGSPEFFAERGYAVVIQDVRGSFKSGGDFYPFQHEGWNENRDGYDTVEWAALQPWSNGKVGTIGGSYTGVTQYRLAPTRPPHLVAMVARESSSDYHEEWAYRGGAFELAFSLSWALGSLTVKNLAHLVEKDKFEGTKKRLEKALEEIDSWYSFLPLCSMPLLDGLSDWYKEWLEHPHDGPYWRQWNVALKHDQVDVPIYHLGAWYDIFLRGTLENFKGIREKGMSERARKGQRLIVGPWAHGPGEMRKSQLAGMDFGPEAAVDPNPFRLRWFDYYLKGIQNGIDTEPPVKIFVMGRNEWRYEDNWPPDSVQYTEYYFGSRKSGSVESLNDGTLSTVHPGNAESPDSYIYDPRKSLPTKGGGTLGIPPGPFDQRDVEVLSLTYTTEPLKEEVEVTGPVICVLYGMSSAPDTDWVVKLCDVHPPDLIGGGSSILIADGIIRARYRESRQRPSLITPEVVYRYEVDLWATSNLFREGHRIRVSISSSNFPRWDRNLNTGGEFGKEAVGKVALNTLFHDAERPSHIVLPIRR